MRWTRKPDGSNWGRWGSEDRYGTLNLLTDQARRLGLEAVSEGKVFVLSLPLNLPGGSKMNPNRKPPILRPNLRAGKPNYLCRLGDTSGFTDVLSDDFVVLHNQYSTQWDALAHAGMIFDADGDGEPEIVFYNGFGPELMQGPDSLAGAGFDSLPSESTSHMGPLSIDAVAQTGVQGRAWLIDARHHLGDGRTWVGLDELRGILEADRISPEPGDILTFHTGLADKIVEMAGDPDPEVLHNYGAVLDGTDQPLLDWLRENDIAAIAADNYAVEGVIQADESQTKPVPMLPLHEHCLVKLGMPLGEMWHLTPLAHHLRERGSFSYFLTAPPLMLPGASGAAVTPVATV